LHNFIHKFRYDKYNKFQDHSSETLGIESIDKTKDALQAKKLTTFVFTRQVGAFFKHSDATPP